MNKNKVANIENLNIYTIPNNYITYLQDYETENRGLTKVSNVNGDNYNYEKLYVGIVLSINNILYFAPLSHPKNHYETNRRFFNRVSIHIKDRNDSLGRIMLCYMIPLASMPQPIDINSIQDIYYRNLLVKQYFFLQSHTEEIKQKANKLYSQIKQGNHYLSNACCDLNILEKACQQWVYEHLEIKLRREYSSKEFVLIKKLDDKHIISLVTINSYGEYSRYEQISNVDDFIRVRIYATTTFGQDKYIEVLIKEQVHTLQAQSTL